jgi:multidrug efflux pump subunit AcrB
MNLPAWSVHHRVAVNMIAISILILGGFLASTQIRRDIFPDVSTNFIRIITVDATTANPEDIERLITIPIEEETSNVDGAIQIISISEDNLSTVFLEIDPSINNLDPILNEVRQQVSRARPKLPITAEEPIIEEFDIPLPLLTLGITLPPGLRPVEIRAAVDQLERDLKVLRGVSEVLVDGVQDREIWVETDPFQLQSLGLSYPQLVQIINQRNQNQVAGRLAGQGGERVIRVDGEITTAEDLSSLPILATGDQLVRLREIASFRETMEEERTRGRINQQTAISFTIIKKSKADALDTAAEVKKAFFAARNLFPEAVEFLVTADTTKYIDVRIRTVVQNGFQALLIVTVLLVCLLNWRLAILIAIGLPISFAGTFIVLHFMGESINLLSLFALIMALGMIVDDAVVIAENVYRHYEEGYSPAEAAIKGTSEVIWPVVGSVSTTMAAFLPLILGEGIIGKFLFVIPVVVISGLLFSLVQAFIILPSHMYDFIRLPDSIETMEKKRRETRSLRRRFTLTIALSYWELRRSVDRGLREIINTYAYLLKICLRWRYAVLGGFLLLFVAGGALLRSDLLRFELFSTDYADRIFIKLDFPSSYSLDQTEEIVAQLEATIVNEIPADDLFGLSTRIGARLDDANQFLQAGSNLALITVDLDETHPNARRPSLIVRDLQIIVGRIPEITQATVETEGGGPPVGRALNIRILGEDFEELRRLADKVENRVARIPGIRDVTNNFEVGKKEFLVVVDAERARERGLSVSEIGQSLQAAYRGLEASRFRQGNDEVIIRVIAEDPLRRDPSILRGLRIMNSRGEAVSIEEVSEIKQTSGLARINRRNQMRLITVSAGVDTDVITSRQANRQVEAWLPELIEQHPSLRFELAGENEDTERSLEAMKVAALIAFLLIYVILAILFNSFLQPLVVMSVIPFGIIGVIGGLVIMGQPMGLMAIMGTIALAGIVVNNSVIFVHFINQERRKYAPDGLRKADKEHARYLRWYSIIHSGRVRFRPIFLTTATTIGGLFTLAFLTSGQEEFLAPMAQAIVFGLLFASAITMILIPCLYAIVDDFKRLSQKRLI